VLPAAEGVLGQGGVEGLAVEVAHDEDRGVEAVDFEGAFVEVGEGFPGHGPVGGRLQLAAAAGGPVVGEHRPGLSLGGFEVDVEGVAGPGGAHHDVLESRSRR